MDKKDEKILIELIKNSRTPIKQVAKKVGVSREVANYRINNLLKQGIIKEFYTEINETLLGFERFGCAIQLKGISEKEEKDFMDKIANSKYTTYLGPIIGKWNFAFDIILKSKKDLEKVLFKLFTEYRDKIKQYVINSTPIDRGFFPAKIFGFVSKDKILKTRNYKLSKLDFEILKILSNNSRTEYSELSKKLGLTANAIKYRINHMENSGIIDSYTIAINYSKLGIEFYNLQIKFSNYNFAKLKKFLIENQKVKYFYKHLGNPDWDLDIGLLIKDSKELRGFLIEIKDKFGEDIEVNDVFLTPEAIKENILPDIVFNGSNNL